MSAAAKRKPMARISPPELAACTRVGDLNVDLPSMAVISNVFRVANAARNHLERHVL